MTRHDTKYAAGGEWVIDGSRDINSKRLKLHSRQSKGILLTKIHQKEDSDYKIEHQTFASHKVKNIQQIEAATKCR
jgi:hypothetical protein